MSKEMRPADIPRDRASSIVTAIYSCGNQLVGLKPETRFIVLRALVAVFLTNDDDVLNVTPAPASPDEGGDSSDV